MHLDAKYIRITEKGQLTIKLKVKGSTLKREKKLFDSTEALMQTLFLLLLFDLEKYA